jgi:pyruvate,water dikinase
VISDPRQPAPPGDHILVARSTDPGWLFLMIASRGIVVEKGSVLSHTAIVGRELGIPTIVGVREATTRIAEGRIIAIDGATGEVRWD